MGETRRLRTLRASSNNPSIGMIEVIVVIWVEKIRAVP